MFIGDFITGGLDREPLVFVPCERLGLGAEPNRQARARASKLTSHRFQFLQQPLFHLDQALQLLRGEHDQRRGKRDSRMRHGVVLLPL
jgi:hypothetical protein